MEEITVKIWREANTIGIPQYATPGSAGVDLCSMKYCILKPGELALIPTGIRLEIPEGYEGQIRPRSGLALNNRIIIPNAPGTRLSRRNHDHAPQHGNRSLQPELWGQDSAVSVCAGSSREVRAGQGT